MDRIAQVRNLFAGSTPFRFAFAIALPLIALGMQWATWELIAPLVWFFFFPAVFFAARLDGLRGALVSASLSAALVWVFFLPPQLTLLKDGGDARHALPSVSLFLIMSYFFGDVHERLRHERKRAEGLFGAMFDQAAVGIAILDETGRLRRANPRLLECVGRDEQDILGKRVGDFASQDDLETALKLTDDATTTASEEIRLVRGSGEIVWMKLTVTRVEPSKNFRNLIVLLVEDIDEQKKAELGLRESEERLRLFIEHAPAALAMFDENMRYIAASRRWRTNFMSCEEDVVGRSHYDAFPDMPEHWRVAHGRGLAGEVVRMEEDHFDRAGLPALWLRWEVRPWRRSDGGVGGIVIFTEDITNSLSAREEIIALNQTLERRVAERTAELATANEELNSFVYAASHDLRAPLRAMRGFSQALLEDFGDQTPPQAMEYLKEIDAAGRRMGDLIDCLLALSRWSRAEMRHDRIDLSAICERLLAELARLDPKRQVAAEVEPGLEVIGDARMVEAAMRNILGNAWKYTERTQQPTIRVHAKEGSGAKEICVCDNGAGFDMAYAARLFQPFQRLHREDEFKGLGIGLATVHRIIRRHGGSIEARSAPGRGATFCFTFASDAPEPTSKTA